MTQHSDRLQEIKNFVKEILDKSVENLHKQARDESFGESLQSTAYNSGCINSASLIIEFIEDLEENTHIDLIDCAAWLDNQPREKFIRMHEIFAEINQIITQETGADRVFMSWGPEAYDMTKQQLLVAARESYNSPSVIRARFGNGEPWYADEQTRRMFEGDPDKPKVDVRDYIKQFEDCPPMSGIEKKQL